MSEHKAMRRNFSISRGFKKADDILEGIPQSERSRFICEAIIHYEQVKNNPSWIMEQIGSFMQQQQAFSQMIPGNSETVQGEVHPSPAPPPAAVTPKPVPAPTPTVPKAPEPTKVPAPEIPKDEIPDPVIPAAVDQRRKRPVPATNQERPISRRRNAGGLAQAILNDN